jgi:hypothetical protein
MKALELMEYLRKRRNGQRVKSGVLLARRVKTKKGNKRVLIGWSKCKLTVDKFDRSMGVQIASGRIQSRLDKTAKKTKIPPSIQEQVESFVKRCKTYFKTKEVKVV